MKLRVFLRLYGVIVVLGIILILGFIWGMPAFRTFIRIAFFASIVISVLLSDTKYIQDLTVENDRLRITYVTQFLQIRTIEIDRASISYLRLPKWIIFSGIWPPNLYIYMKVDGELKTFSISGKRMYKELQSELASADLVKSYT